jgi:Tol biopolymer transport system component
VNLGSVVNTSGDEGAPTLSADGHWLYFYSNRPGGEGGLDLYVSYRHDTDDDLGWEPAINLGPQVNTAATESGAEFVAAAPGGTPSLLFNRRAAPALFDLYSAPIGADGKPTAAAIPIVELNSPFSDVAPGVSRDGREIFFYSERPGTLGADDIWRSTRRSVHDPWSMPENLGTPIATTSTERQPALSRDGRTLLYDSDRPGGFGSRDIWMSTRTRLQSDHRH